MFSPVSPVSPQAPSLPSVPPTPVGQTLTQDELAKATSILGVSFEFSSSKENRQGLTQIDGQTKVLLPCTSADYGTLSPTQYLRHMVNMVVSGKQKQAFHQHFGDLYARLRTGTHRPPSPVMQVQSSAPQSTKTKAHIASAHCSIAHQRAQMHLVQAKAQAALAAAKIARLDQLKQEARATQIRMHPLKYSALHAEQMRQIEKRLLSQISQNLIEHLLQAPVLPTLPGTLSAPAHSTLFALSGGLLGCADQYDGTSETVRSLLTCMNKQDVPILLTLWPDIGLQDLFEHHRATQQANIDLLKMPYAQALEPRWRRFASQTHRTIEPPAKRCKTQ